LKLKVIYTNNARKTICRYLTTALFNSILSIIPLAKSDLYAWEICGFNELLWLFWGGTIDKTLLVMLYVKDYSIMMA